MTVSIDKVYDESDIITLSLDRGLGVLSLLKEETDNHRRELRLVSLKSHVVVLNFLYNQRNDNSIQALGSYRKLEDISKRELSDREYRQVFSV